MTLLHLAVACHGVQCCRGGFSGSTLSYYSNFPSANCRVEVLPFSYLVLSRGKWVPRNWPPNLGAKRDIPLGAEIHPSVLVMKRSGILQPSDMPKLGGKEPY